MDEVTDDVDLAHDQDEPVPEGMALDQPTQRYLVWCIGKAGQIVDVEETDSAGLAQHRRDCGYGQHRLWMEVTYG